MEADKNQEDKRGNWFSFQPKRNVMPAATVLMGQDAGETRKFKGELSLFSPQLCMGSELYHRIDLTRTTGITTGMNIPSDNKCLLGINT